MPELPEVQSVLDGVLPILQKRRVLGLQSYYPGTLILDPDLGEKVFPLFLKKTWRRGKYMIFDFEEGYSFIVHLRMTGKLVYEPCPVGIHKHERARFELENGEAIRFIDPRTFGKIWLFKSESLERYLPNLGVEPLGDGFDEAYLANALKGRKAPVKNLLLDQRLIAGLGNIYVCELLYRSGVRPDRSGESVKSSEIKRMVKDTKEVLREAIIAGGTSISDYRNVDDKSGEFQRFLRVYQKKACPKGHDIENIRLGGRSSFFCPKCQK
ncbi:MAG: bifunctional DNA-formamidopyrimidine glycosylase/DNA-(apurinic or apyrimidinic site) lyase [Candidatus Cloacimonetes bacterium]|nr:bifunctional DNA-formamidopyrimidine glycosylase/DNA-(apurinic or apyrimidinic site) lyase [Candidatus Cloacimonadota bacterium]